MDDRHLIYLLRYQVKDRGKRDALANRLRRLGLAKMPRAELTVAPLGDRTLLNGCGLIIVTPPRTLAGELAILLPALAKILGRGPKPGCRLDWLAGEASAAR